MAKPVRGTLGSVTERLITAEDALQQDSPYRHCEIWDGVAILKDPCGGQSSAVSVNVIAPLAMHVRAGDLGWVFGSNQGFLVARSPDRLLGPDAAFVAQARLERVPERDFIELAPDFLIEVRSPTDSWEKTVHKCGLWIAHGARVVWAIDPLTRTVAVLRGEDDVEVLHGERSASAAPALPAFELPLGEIFLT